MHFLKQKMNIMSKNPVKTNKFTFLSTKFNLLNQEMSQAARITNFITPHFCSTHNTWLTKECCSLIFVIVASIA